MIPNRTSKKDPGYLSKLTTSLNILIQKVFHHNKTFLNFRTGESKSDTRTFLIFFRCSDIDSVTIYLQK